MRMDSAGLGAACPIPLSGSLHRPGDQRTSGRLYLRPFVVARNYGERTR
jgi:hypothetical protein